MKDAILVSLQDLEQRRLASLMEFMAWQLVNRVFLVGPDRGSKKSELEPISGLVPVGRHGERTMLVLSVLFANSEYTAPADRVRGWAGTFGLDKLVGGWVGEPGLRASFSDRLSAANVPTDYAGFGSQQILPVITQLFSAPPGKSETRVVVDTNVFVLAVAGLKPEARFYSAAIRRCWKLVFSGQIIEEYQRVIREYGYRSEVVLLELNKLDGMNKYRHCSPELERIGAELASHDDRHVVAPCQEGQATVIVTKDSGLLGRKAATWRRLGLEYWLSKRRWRF